jgi:hypothetical protein
MSLFRAPNSPALYRVVSAFNLQTRIHSHDLISLQIICGLILRPKKYPKEIGQPQYGYRTNLFNGIPIAAALLLVMDSLLGQMLMWFSLSKRRESFLRWSLEADQEKLRINFLKTQLLITHNEAVVTRKGYTRTRALIRKH